MPSIRYHLFATVSLLMGLAISLAACQKDGSSAPNAPSPEASPLPVVPRISGGGGIDGSGGDSNQSTFEEVRAAIKSEQAALLQRLDNLSSKFEGKDQTVYDFQFGSGAYQLLKSFLGLSVGVFDPSSLHMALRTGAIQIKVQTDSCNSEDGDHAGSAKGDFKKGEICISTKKLQTIPPKVLNEEIFLLIIHELSHLAGFNEGDAVKLQKLLSQNREMYSQYNDTGFINGLATCDWKEIEAEAKQMEKLSYWKEKKLVLLEMLSGEQPRGCDTSSSGFKSEDRVAIFSDDAEFLNVTRKFQHADFRWRMKDTPESETTVTFGSDTVEEITSVASIFVKTATAVISIKSKVGSNAQCSPKILMANLIANVPAVMEIRCGNGVKEQSQLEKMKIRIQKEKEILSGEPK